MDFYNYFSVLIQEMDLDIDASLVNALLKFINWNPGPQELEGQDEAVGFTLDSTDTSKMMYFEILHLNPVKVNISYSTPEYLMKGDRKYPSSLMLCLHASEKASH